MTENGDFQRRKQRLQGTLFSGKQILRVYMEGDEVTKNDDFQIWKQCLQGTHFSETQTNKGLAFLIQMKKARLCSFVLC